MSGLSVDFSANISGLTNGISQATSQLNSFVSSANSRLQSFGDNISSIGQKMSIGFSVPLGLLGTQALKTSADFEQTQIAFETMLGSASKATYLVGELQKQAQKSPLEEKDLQQAAKTLLNFGVAGNSVLPVLNQLSDVSQGNAQRFSGLSLAFGQMSSTGRLMGQDLNQMINAGFNPLQEISRTTGQSMADLKNKMEGGQISVEMVSEAFKTATSEGGRFYGSTEKQSKSLAGLYSSMQDSIGKSLKGLGDDISNALNLKEIIPQVGAFISNISNAFSDLDPNIKKAVLVFGGLLVVIPPILAGIGALIPVFTALSAGVALVSAPVLAVGVGIAGLAYIVTTNWTEIKKFLSDTGIWDGISLIIQNTFGVIKGIFNGAVSIIKSIWNSGLEILHNDTFGIFGVISGVISSALQVIGGIIGVFSNLLQGNWSGIWTSLKNIMKGSFNAIITITEGFIVTITGAFQKVFEFFGADKIVAQFKQATDSIKKQFEGFKYKVELDPKGAESKKKETKLDSDLGYGNPQKQSTSDKGAKAQEKAQKDTEDLLVKLAQFKADIIEDEVKKAIDGENAKFEKEKNSIERTKANIQVKNATIQALEASHAKAIADIQEQAQKKATDFIINSFTNQIVKERALEQISFEEKLKNIPKIIQGVANQNKAIELLEIEHQAKMREIEGKGQTKSITPLGVKLGGIGSSLYDGSDGFGKVGTFTNPIEQINNSMKTSIPKLQSTLAEVTGVFKLGREKMLLEWNQLGKTGKPSLNLLTAMLKDSLPSVADTMLNMGKIIDNGVKSMVGGFAKIVGAMVVGKAGIADIGSMLLQGLGGILTQLGEQLIASSVSFALVASALTLALTPAGAGLALAAGVGLVALGSALSSSASSGSSGASSGSGSYAQNYSSGANSYGGGNSYGNGGQVLTLNLNMSAETRLQGNDILTAIKRTEKQQVRIRA
jgi:tape measure domain-containing protein